MAKSIVTGNRRTACWGDPPIFRHDNDALHWAVGQGAYPTIEAAGRVFAELRAKYDNGVWARWLGTVGRRLEGFNTRR